MPRSARYPLPHQNDAPMPCIRREYISNERDVVTFGPRLNRRWRTLHRLPMEHPAPAVEQIEAWGLCRPDPETAPRGIHAHESHPRMGVGTGNHSRLE